MLRAVSEANAARLPLSRILLYSLPFVGYLAMSMPVSMWFAKFATDRLLIAPAVMGAIIFGARLWDAVSDPLAGYLSDRTRSRFGRRRVWMVGGAIPVAATYVMLWSPPASLDPGELILWITVAMLAWETASTAVLVPYGALGLELTDDYHDRTRLFGWRQALLALGFGASLVALGIIRNEADYPDAEMPVAIVTGALFASTLLVCAWRVPEPERHQGRGAARLWSAFGDVLRNPHARRLLVVLAIDSFGMGMVASLGAFMAEDVVNAPDLLEEMMAVWMVPQFLCVPIWIRLSRRIGKKPLWLAGMATSVVGFTGLLFIGEGDVLGTLAQVLVLGVGTSIGLVIGPSVQADVVDYDELVTGDRKEGAYVAVWNFLRKVGGAVAMSLGLFVIDFAGYDPQAEMQNEAVRDAIRFVMGAVPAFAFAIGAVLFAGFSLNEAEHRALREELAARAERSG